MTEPEPEVRVVDTAESEDEAVSKTIIIAAKLRALNQTKIWRARWRSLDPRGIGGRSWVIEIVRQEREN